MHEQAEDRERDLDKIEPGEEQYVQDEFLRGTMNVFPFAYNDHGAREHGHQPETQKVHPHAFKRRQRPVGIHHGARLHRQRDGKGGDRQGYDRRDQTVRKGVKQHIETRPFLRFLFEHARDLLVRIGKKRVKAALEPTHALFDDRSESDRLFVEKFRSLAVADLISVRHEVEGELGILGQTIPAPAVL